MTTTCELSSQTRELLDHFEKAGLAHCTKTEEPLGRYTSFGVGGTAEIMVAPDNEEDIVQAFHVCRSLNVTPKVLGGGYKLMVLSERLPVVISTRKLQGMQIEGNRIEVKSGTQLPVLIKKAVYHGLSGLETLVGIPGTIGGSIAGNAGSKPEGTPAEIGSLVEEVRAIAPDGTLQHFDRSSLKFEYRNSNLRNHLILSAVLVTGYRDVPTLMERWQKFFRMKSQNQPYSAKSAGCVFKNPTTVAAWKLIHDAGLAGKTVGRAAISEKHANFIINLGGACAQEVWELLQLIRTRILQMFGVELALEVQIW